MTLEAGTRLGPYEIGSPLGAGGMGEVYKAKDTRLDRSVAIKVLPAHLSSDTDLRARFEREARVVSSLNHPHICTLHDIGHQDGVDFLVMEYLDGETLADRLGKGALPLEQALRFGIQIADALDRAHRAGVVHRDLKPGNVILAKSGAKLLDFGLAKALASATATGLSTLATEAKPLTEKGTVLGTVQYMAPEQLEGKDADARSDVFAFGSVLYEMLTGRRAFTGSSQASLIGAILRDEPPAVTTLQPLTPVSLDRVVATCLAKDPDERWQSAHDLGRELRWIAEGSGAVRTASTAVPPGGPRRAIRGAAIAGSLALLAMTAALGRFSHRAAQPPPALRFVVPPAALGSIEDAPVVAPDGRSVAYALASEDGSSALWLHSFESGEAKRLSGSEGAKDAFFSPDGASLAFFARGQLQRIDLATGAAQPLCRAADSRGGAWSESGTILFTPNTASPLFSVPAGGGTPNAATTLLEGEQSHRFPVFLPDGRHLLFVSHADERRAGVIWAEIGTTKRSRILTDAVRAAYDPRGYLLFTRSGTLLAQRFDAARGVLAGDPVPIANHVGSDQGVRAKTWFSAAGGTIAWRPGTAGESKLVWYDRSGRPLADITRPGAYAEPALSPDASRVAVQRIDERGAYSIWTYDAQSKDRGTRVTFDPEEGESPVWMPDGASVVYLSHRAGGFALVRRLAGGGGAEEVLLTLGQKLWPKGVSKDGRFLAIEGGGANGYDVTLLPLSGDRKPVAFASSPANETHADFSPDGALLAYVSDETGRAEVFVQPVPRGDGIAADRSRWQVSVEGGDMPSWSGDGGELFYVAPGRKLMVVAIQGRAPLVAGEPKMLFTAAVQVTSSTGNRNRLQPTADGKRFLVLASSDTGIEPWLRVISGWRPR